MNAMRIRKGLPLLSLALLLASGPVFAGATITIVNANAPGVGFNDATPVAAVGGNSGTTLGEQRLIAFEHAAGIWGATLDSNVAIKIYSTFEALSCTATSAVLGSAGTLFIWRDFPGVAPFPGAEYPSTWYHQALANKRAGTQLNDGSHPTYGDSDLLARFNVNLGNVGCLTGTGWYLGLDGNHGTQIDLVTVLEHEFAHGLGFSQFASVTSGAQQSGLTDVYGRRILDTTTGKHWNEMIDAERVASAINPRRVVWDGPNVAVAVPQVLSIGTPLLRVNTPPAIAGNYQVGTAAFGPPLASPGISGTVVQALDPADGAGPTTFDACSPLTNAAAVAGNIAMVDRGTCGFTIKVKNAQNAGAIAVIVADNAAGGPPGGLGGADATITIPAVRITLADAITIKAQLVSGVAATLGVDLAVRSGADASGRALLYTPNPVQTGSTISHFDTIAFRNQLMEPSINADLTHSVAPPEDMTLPLLRDVGWFPDSNTDGFADYSFACTDWTPEVGTWGPGAAPCGDTTSMATTATYESQSYFGTFGDFTYEVDLTATRPNQPTAANSIFVRGAPTPRGQAQAWNSGYIFSFTSSGKYAIFRMNLGRPVVVQAWVTPVGTTIRPSGQPNTLKVVANGGTLTFSINGVAVKTITGQSVLQGKIGVGMVRSVPTGGGPNDTLIVNSATLDLAPPPPPTVVSRAQQMANEAANMTSIFTPANMFFATDAKK